MYETDVLVVGSGPAGSSAALALSTYGVRNMVVTKHRWLADTPRAHYINQRTMEIMRDLGVDAEIIAKAASLRVMGNVVFCTSLSGVELGRLPYGANSAKRRSDYALASPCEQCDLPQHLLEPILLSNAASRGSHVRFDTEYLAHEQDADGVTVTLKDRLAGSHHSIRCKYLLGADGGNSKIASDLNLPMEGQMGKSGSISIILHADLTRFVAHRPGYLWWVLQPGSGIGGIGMGLLRMVRPWTEWQIVWGYDIDEPAPMVTEADAIRIAHQFFGDSSVDVEIKSISLWTVNEMSAARYSDRRVLCLGDAVHRHPPSNGLGSNTSIQDAYNLAWKLKLALSGAASPGMLASYDEERVPVGRQVIRRANKSVRDFGHMFDALGISGSDEAETMNRNIAAVRDDSPLGATRREHLRRAIALKSYEFATLGVELNVRYESSSAIIHQGMHEAVPSSFDPELHYQASVRPGGRLPHVWLNRRGQEISSLDLAGNGCFTLLTGIGGDVWIHAAQQMAAEFGVPISCVLIGPGRDVEDLYGDWSELREGLASDGFLVRPDAYIAWRGNVVEASNGALRHVFLALLGRLRDEKGEACMVARHVQDAMS
ncbi:2,4-dichlorophenol 6-monooxygenase [Verminephrobacter eiseniae]|uniref:FAD-dependent oxidoreductase n=1 Tax=Verminephrobacter eiseniae TaxID=364317 RepID=UPI0022388FEC|nr:FAD-dependent monooxygenase [Verminephrobacter eiseniae]MCW5262001.1 2,4-dichlorophenol 6-monooxygenase [Verminephrobacter eiseniae]